MREERHRNCAAIMSKEISGCNRYPMRTRHGLPLRRTFQEIIHRSPGGSDEYRGDMPKRAHRALIRLSTRGLAAVLLAFLSAALGLRIATAQEGDGATPISAP